MSAAKRPRHKTRHPGVYYRERPDGSRIYLIWYMGTDGKARFENVPGGERDAVRARSRIIDRKARGEQIAPTNLKVKDWAPQWLEEREIENTNTYATKHNAIKTHIVPRLGNRKVCDLDVNHVADFIAELRRDGKKANTINVILTTLSGMMRTAVRRGLATQNPVGQLDINERPKKDSAKMEILDSGEIQGFLAAAPKEWYVLLACAVFTGMRVSELLALRWEDVDWDAEVVHVKDSKTRAGVREVVLMESLKKTLAAESLKAQHELVFHNLKGEQLQRANVSRSALKPALAAAGVTKRIRFHDLRHTYASILIHQGHTPAFICEQMGHADISVTLRVYGHLFDRDAKRKDARDKLEAEFGAMLGNGASQGQVEVSFAPPKSPDSPPV